MAIDAPIRPENSLLCIAAQSAEGSPAVPSAATDAIPFETDSLDYNGPFRSEATTEANGSFVASAPMVVGQPATISFRSRLKGAGPGVAYTASVRPPLHVPLQICGMLGQFVAAIAAAALTAGTAQSATLGASAPATAQALRGVPLLLTGAPAAGRASLIADYTAGKVATLTDVFGSALSATNQAAVPATWTYAGTTPSDAASRASMHPCATVYLYEDGVLHQWQDCRGTVTYEGAAGQPGFAVFNLTGVYMGRVDAAMPTNPVVAGHSAPLLVQGAGTQPAFQINRRGLAISRWSINPQGSLETPDDPNSTYGFAGGQIAGRTPMLELDPLTTLVATRNSLADIAAFAQHVASIQMGSVAGNRVSIMVPVGQPVETTPGKRGKLRSETLRYQLLTPGRDNANRDGDFVLAFS
jgi:hypothetical protein